MYERIVTKSKLFVLASLVQRTVSCPFILQLDHVFGLMVARRYFCLILGSWLENCAITVLFIMSMSTIEQTWPAIINDLLLLSEKYGD